MHATYQPKLGKLYIPRFKVDEKFKKYKNRHQIKRTVLQNRIQISKRKFKFLGLNKSLK